MKFCTHVDETFSWKKTENNFFIICALHCENGIWNIKIFAFYCDELKYLGWLFFEEKANSSPKALPFKSREAIWSPTLLMMMSNNSKYSVQIQVVLQTYVKKVKLHPNCNQNIFSEITELEENGGDGGNLTQFPISNFTWG